MLRVFLTSRPGPSGDIADRIADHLMRRYGLEGVVRNVSGRSLDEYLHQVDAWMRRCNVALIVIGPDWLQARDAHGARLLDNPNDPVRVEVRTALQLGKLVVPLLVGGARMPSAQELPPDLAALALRNAYTVRPDPAFYDDMLRVYDQINTQLAWRPASTWALAGGAVGLLAELVGWVIFPYVPSYQLLFAFLLFMIAGFLIALAGDGIAVLRYKGWGWLAALIGALIVLVGSLALDDTLQVNANVEYAALGIAFVVFLACGLFGPRRETSRAW